MCIIAYDARFEVLTAMKILVEVVTPRSVAVRFQCFGGPWCLHLQGEEKRRWRKQGPPKYWYNTATQLHNTGARLRVYDDFDVIWKRLWPILRYYPNA